MPPDDADRPEELPRELSPAAENPWYVLATIRGERIVDVEKNRRIWNGWSCAHLPEAKRVELSRMTGLAEADLAPWTVQEREEVTEAFGRRALPLPSPEALVDFASTHFSEPLNMSGFVFSSIVFLRAPSSAGSHGSKRPRSGEIRLSLAPTVGLAIAVSKPRAMRTRRSTSRPPFAACWPRLLRRSDRRPPGLSPPGPAGPVPFTAHVKLCVLALMIQRAAETTTAMPWRQLHDLLDPIKAVRHTTEDRTIVQAGKIRPEARGVLIKLDISTPKTILDVA